MHILFLAATTFEIQPVIDQLHAHKGKVGHHTVDTLIAGVGLVNTTFQLTRAIHQHRPDFIIQAGIAGSFSTDYAPGTTALISQDLIADLGVEEQGQFKDVFDMGFQQADQFPFQQKWLVNPTAVQYVKAGLQLVSAISINEITTRQERIAQLQQKYQPATESMEGAALHYVALQEHIPFLQVRAVSNYVGERNKAHWRIKDAIEALNEKLMALLPAIH